MLTTENYIMAWLVYLFGAVGVYAVLQEVVKSKLGEQAQLLIRTLLITILLTPWFVSPEMDLLVPAVIIVLFEVGTQGLVGIYRAGIPLLTACFFASILLFFWQARRQSKQDKQPA